MSKFDETVEKLSANPAGVDRLRKLATVKEAGKTEELYNTLSETLKSIPGLGGRLRSALGATTVLATGTAAGKILTDLVQDIIMSDRKTNQKSKEEKAKLRGQAEWKSEVANTLSPMQKRVFHKVIKEDEILSDADTGMLQSTFHTMQRFAPTLASDPNAVRSFLRESAAYGTGPNYAALKNLADAEKSVSASASFPHLNQK